MARKKTTKKGKAPKVSTKSKRTRAVLNADAFGIGVPKIKKVRRIKVEKAIAAMRIAEPMAPLQEVVEQVEAIPDVMVLHVGASKKDAPVFEAKKTASKAAAHTLRTLASKRGADLVRYLKIHARTPYGPRGESAIARLAVEVGHLANLELGAVGRDRPEAQEGVMKQTYP